MRRVQRLLPERARFGTPSAGDERARAALRVLARLAIGAGFILFAFLALHNWVSAVQVVSGHRGDDADAVDFTAFYTAGALVVHGHGAQLFDRPTFDVLQHSYGVRALHPAAVMPFLNPPVVALLFAPLGLLSFSHAFQAWAALMLLVMLVPVAIVLAEGRGESLAFRAFLVFFLLGASSFAFSVRLGQFSPLLLAAWMCAYVAFRRGDERLAGVALAACLVKPEIVIPLLGLLAWKRHGTILTTFGGAALVLAAVSVAVVGPETALTYPGHVLHSAGHEGDGTYTAIMVGWNGIFSGLLDGSSLGRSASIAASMATLALLAAAFRRSGKLDAATSLAPAWLLITMATTLADPHFYKQDALILVGPVCMYLLHLRGSARFAAACVAMGGATILQLGWLPVMGHASPLFGLYVAVCCVPLWFAVRASARPIAARERIEDERSQWSTAAAA